MQRPARRAKRVAAGMGIAAALHLLFLWFLWFLFCGPVPRRMEVVPRALVEVHLLRPEAPRPRPLPLRVTSPLFVQSCRGTPGTVNGQPVPMRGLTPITWKLTG